MTVQTMNGNVAPQFCYCWTHFWSTSWSSNYAYDISFQSLGSQESSASNDMWFGGEMKKLWLFEDKRAKMSENFATETPFERVFRSCETNFGTRVPFCSTVLLILSCEMSCEINFELRNHFWALKWMRNDLQASEWLRKCSKLKKWSVNMPLFCEMISKLWNGCEITYKLRNGLQIAKLICEMEEGLQKHFAKPREVAKMPTEPHNHASEEESPEHLEITHTKSLTPFLTSLNHQSS